MTEISKSRADNCVTHHHACDCREYEFQEMRRELEALRGKTRKME
jgi:hypothetical protein